MLHTIHIICFILLVVVAVFAFVSRLRPTGADLTAAAVALIGIAYTAALALARVALVFLLFLTGCTVSGYYEDKQGTKYGGTVTVPKDDGKTALR